MSAEPQTFGSVVRERMRARGVTPRELAHAIHRSESQVSLLVRDKIATPTPDVVAAIATYLDIDEAFLVRLIGYLSTVPTGPSLHVPEEATPERRKLMELLQEVQLTPDRAAGLEGTLERWIEFDRKRGEG